MNIPTKEKMNELIVKIYQGYQLRICKNENGQIWFYAKDACEILGLKNISLALKKLKNEHKAISNRYTLGGEQGVLIVSEPGLYKLVFQSRRKEAGAFQDWVFEEVLPSIRKTGSYHVEPKSELSPLDILENHLKQMRKLEAANTEMSITVQNVQQGQMMLSNKVDNIETTVNQFTRHTTGNEKLPPGLITIQKLTHKYFTGISEAVVNDFLKLIGHPCEPLTYKVGNSFHTKDIYVEAGLNKAFEKLIRESFFVKQTALNIQVKHPQMKNEFRIKKSQAQNWAQELLLR